MIKKSQEHLNSVNEGCAEHMSLAFKVSLKMINRGLIPVIFERNASGEIKELYNYINQKKL